MGLFDISPPTCGVCEDRHYLPCPICKGTGRIMDTPFDAVIMQKLPLCPECKGAKRRLCPNCMNPRSPTVMIVNNVGAPTSDASRPALPPESAGCLFILISILGFWR